MTVKYFTQFCNFWHRSFANCSLFHGEQSFSFILIINEIDKYEGWVYDQNAFLCPTLPLAVLFSILPLCVVPLIILLLRGNLKKTSIFKDIVQIGGREVNPISKNWKELIFWQKGVTKHIVKIYYSIWPNQGTLCLSDCTPDPQKVIRIIENVNSKPKMSWFLSKILGEGGRSTWSTLCQK